MLGERLRRVAATTRRRAARRRSDRSCDGRRSRIAARTRVAVEQIDVLPRREPAICGGGADRAPADDVVRAGEVFEEMAAGEAGRAGHENGTSLTASRV